MKNVLYVGTADHRIVTREDLEKAQVTVADSFETISFRPGIAHELTNTQAEALVESGLFVNFEYGDDSDKVSLEKQATDKDVQEAGGTPGASDSTSTTGTASSTTSGTTGSGTTAGSTSRSSR